MAHEVENQSQMNLPRLPGAKPINNEFDRLKRFPEKLWEALSDPKSDLIRWSKDGKSILVDEKRFPTEVMHLYPGLVQISSFANLRRQLREYGFGWKISHLGEYEFSHPYFIRGRIDLLADVKTKRKVIQENPRAAATLKSKRRIRNKKGPHKGIGDPLYSEKGMGPCPPFWPVHPMYGGGDGYGMGMPPFMPPPPYPVPMSQSCQGSDCPAPHSGGPEKMDPPINADGTFSPDNYISQNAYMMWYPNMGCNAMWCPPYNGYQCPPSFSQSLQSNELDQQCEETNPDPNVVDPGINPCAEQELKVESQKAVDLDVVSHSAENVCEHIETVEMVAKKEPDEDQITTIEICQESLPVSPQEENGEDKSLTETFENLEQTNSTTFIEDTDPTQESVDNSDEMQEVDITYLVAQGVPSIQCLPVLQYVNPNGNTEDTTGAQTYCMTSQGTTLTNMQPAGSICSVAEAARSAGIPGAVHLGTGGHSMEQNAPQQPNMTVL